MAQYAGFAKQDFCIALALSGWPGGFDSTQLDSTLFSEMKPQIMHLNASGSATCLGHF